MSRPKVTITHHDVGPPQYDIEALKRNIAGCDKHIAMLQSEIDNQKAQQKELQRLIEEQTERNN